MSHQTDCRAVEEAALRPLPQKPSPPKKRKLEKTRDMRGECTNKHCFTALDIARFVNPTRTATQIGCPLYLFRGDHQIHAQCMLPPPSPENNYAVIFFLLCCPSNGLLGKFRHKRYIIITTTTIPAAMSVSLHILLPTSLPFFFSSSSKKKKKCSFFFVFAFS